MTQAGVPPRGIWLPTYLPPHSPTEPAMPDEARLREHARDAVEQKKLPNRPPDRVWGGPGIGVACTICGRPVTKDEMEFEVEFAEDGASPHFAVYHVHIRCFSAWELVRSKVDGHPRP